MKKLTAAAALFLTSTSAFAHLEIGTYMGKDAQGQACSFEVRAIAFHQDRKHPLNERVTIAVAGGDEYVLSHLPIVNLATGDIDFDGDHLTATLGVTDGATAAVLTMSHSAGNHGPVSLALLSQNYRTGLKSGSLCSELKHSR